MESIGVSDLVQLATRRERLARATHATQWPGTLPARRNHFRFDHDPNLDLQRSTFRITPGGRWLLALAWRETDESGHLLCWDVETLDVDDTTSLFPVASSRIELPVAPKNCPALSVPYYDPESQAYHCFIILSHEMTTKIVRVTMKCPENRSPCLDVTTKLKIWAYQARGRLSLSGCWVVVHRGNGDSTSIVWNAQTEETLTYSLSPWAPKSFDTLVVTYGGTVFQVHGEVNDDHLMVRFSKASNGPNPSSDCSASVQIPRTGPGRHWLAKVCDYIVTPLGPMRLTAGKTSTVVKLKCTTMDHEFSGCVALSENGTLCELPLLDEPWRLNEHTVPMWITQPSFHFTLTESPNSRQAATITADHKELFLFAAPHRLYNTESEEGQGLFSVPTLPSDISFRTDDWGCNGVCPRSGSWLLTRRSQDGWLAAIIRSD